MATIGSFEIQHEIYYSHFNELLMQFQQDFNFSTKKEFTIAEILKNYIPETITRYQLTSAKQNQLLETKKNTGIENESLEPNTEIE